MTRRGQRYAIASTVVVMLSIVGSDLQARGRTDRAAVRKAKVLADSADKADRAGKFEQAAELFLRAFHHAPQHHDYLQRHAHSLWLHGDTKGAVAAIEQLLALPKLSRKLQKQAQLELLQARAFHRQKVRREKAKLAAAPPPLAPAANVATAAPAAPKKPHISKSATTAAAAPPQIVYASGRTTGPIRIQPPRRQSTKSATTTSPTPPPAAKPAPAPAKRCVIVKRIVVVRPEAPPKVAPKAAPKAVPKPAPKRVATRRPAPPPTPAPPAKRPVARSPVVVASKPPRQPGRRYTPPRNLRPQPRATVNPRRHRPRRSKSTNGSRTAATVTFVAATLAIAGGVLVAITANSRENTLAQTRLGGTDVFDLTRTTKPDAVTGTNQTINLWNAAIALGTTGVVATGVGAWLWKRTPQEARKDGKIAAMGSGR